MPDKPSTWAAALAWLSQHAAVFYAPLLSLVTSALRIIYGGGTRRQAALEALLCASLGAGIGFIGVKKISDWADRLADIKLPHRSAD